MLLQSAVSAASQLHPLSGTIAEWVWLLPILPLAGFVINGLLSLAGAHFGPSDPNTPAHDDAGHPHADRVVFVQGDPQITHVEADAEDDHHGVKRHRWAGAVSVVGPGVLILSFLLALAIWQAMVAANPTTPFLQTYFSWVPVGDL